MLVDPEKERVELWVERDAPPCAFVDPIWRDGDNRLPAAYYAEIGDIVVHIETKYRVASVRGRSTGVGSVPRG